MEISWELERRCAPAAKNVDLRGISVDFHSTATFLRASSRLPWGLDKLLNIYKVPGPWYYINVGYY